MLNRGNELESLIRLGLLVCLPQFVLPLPFLNASHHSSGPTQCICEEPSSRLNPRWSFRLDHRQLQGFAWLASWGKAALPMLDSAAPGHRNLWSELLPSPTSPAVLLWIEYVHSKLRCLYSGSFLLGASAEALPRHLHLDLLFRDLTKALFSPLTQYFPSPGPWLCHSPACLGS